MKLSNRQAYPQWENGEIQDRDGPGYHTHIYQENISCLTRFLTNMLPNTTVGS
jgi:hypothetical protein